MRIEGDAVAMIANSPRRASAEPHVGPQVGMSSKVHDYRRATLIRRSLLATAPWPHTRIDLHAIADALETVGRKPARHPCEPGHRAGAAESCRTRRNRCAVNGWGADSEHAAYRDQMRKVRGFE